MSEPILIPPGGGEVVGDSAERRVEILSDAESVNATWSRFAPGREGADLHVHRHHHDIFYALEGEVTVRLGLEGEEVIVPAGTLARVPPMVVHGFRNGSRAEMSYLNFHAPGMRFTEYMRAIRDKRKFSYDQHPPPDDGGRPTSEAVVGGEEPLADRPGLRVALLAEVEEIAVSETVCDTSGPTPPPHVHRRHTESFYVLEGEMSFTADGRELAAPAGSWVQIPPGVAHSFVFVGAAPVRFLSVHAPSSGFAAFLREVHRAGADDERAVAATGFDEEPAS